ncbi:MAG: protein-L-isoaspartate O-methyltransferase [Burkholderiales bacterium]|nr:protein-L-isoaspartate O-methyltransferase [Burkholderiales bacterium]
MDIERARFNMIESQIRTWEVLDQAVLDTLAEVRREEFVPPQYRSLAFVDMEIPLGHGEAMLAPKLEARLLQELTLQPADRVLEVGTGSGYQAALLAHRAAHVYSIELSADLSASAARKLARLGIGNVTLRVGNGALGWPEEGPFDAILLTGSVPVIPPGLREQLADGGRLLAVVGEPPVMTARLVTQISPGVYNETGLFETCIAPLREVRQPERFVF